MPRYQAIVTFDSDEPLDQATIDAVSFGLFVAVDDPSDDEGSSLGWSGSKVAVGIFPLEGDA
jgi:hypothetical protein